MDKYWMRAADLVEAQAKGRQMTTEEMQHALFCLAQTLYLIDKVPADQLQHLASGGKPSELPSTNLPFGTPQHLKTDDPETSGIWKNPCYAIEDDTITCLICGEKLQQISRQHLTSHALTVKEYREKFRYSVDVMLKSRNASRAELIAKGKMKDIDPQDAITDDYILCMECGRRSSILTKEHLLRKHGLTAEAYRDRWGYPKDTKLACKKPKIN